MSSEVTHGKEKFPTPAADKNVCVCVCVRVCVLVEEEQGNTNDVRQSTKFLKFGGCPRDDWAMPTSNMPKLSCT